VKRPVLIVCLFLLISIFSFLFFFRSEPVKFSAITVKDKFSLSIPEYLTKTDSIDGDALVQYENEAEHLFLLAYDVSDSLDTPLEIRFAKFSDQLISKIGEAVLLKYYPTQINGQKAMIGNIRGTVDETRAYYRIVLIESGNLCYELLIGVSDSNRTYFEDDINSIIQSFRFLPS